MAGGRTLTVTLVANTKNFATGMRDAVRNAEGFKGKLQAVGSSLSMVAGPAFLAAGAAAGAFAIKLGVDGVKAAIQEEAAIAKLTKTLTNLGLAHDVPRIEAFVDNLQFASGTADTELRPAFERLALATGDTDVAMRALSLALDISAGKGKSLESVANALGRAYDGSTTALGKLGTGLDATILKSGDMAAITTELSRLFAGQASTAANTMQGRMQRVGIAVDELKEAFGTGLLDAVESADEGLGSMSDTLRDMQPYLYTLGTVVGGTANQFALLAERAKAAGNDLGVPANDGVKNFLTTVLGLGGLLKTVNGLLGFMGMEAEGSGTKATAAMEQLQRATANSVKGQQLLTEAMGGQAAALEGTESTRGRYLSWVEDLEATQRAAARASTALTGALDAVDAAISRAQAMQDYRDALKEFISAPSKETAMTVASSMTNVAGQMEKPKQAAKFTADAVRDIQKAAKDAGVAMPSGLQDTLLSARDAAIDALNPIGSIKKDLEEIKSKDVYIRITSNWSSMDPAEQAALLRRATGGSVYATGGPVRAATGTHASDSVFAMLSRGEYVLNADTVKRVGVGTLNRINNGGAMSGRGFTIENLNVTSAPGERAEESIPRALRRMAFLVGQ